MNVAGITHHGSPWWDILWDRTEYVWSATRRLLDTRDRYGYPISGVQGRDRDFVMLHRNKILDAFSRVYYAWPSELGDRMREARKAAQEFRKGLDLIAHHLQQDGTSPATEAAIREVVLPAVTSLEESLEVALKECAVDGQEDPAERAGACGAGAATAERQEEER